MYGKGGTAKDRQANNIVINTDPLHQACQKKDGNPSKEFFLKTTHGSYISEIHT